MSKSTEFALKLWPMVIAMAVMLCMSCVEKQFFPVVDSFQVTSMRREGDALKLWGIMRKTRACTFVGVSAVGEDGKNHTDLRLSFEDRANNVANHTRESGSQDWGPWTIWLPVRPQAKTLTLTATHRCHPGWTSDTKLITINLEDAR